MNLESLEAFDSLTDKEATRRRIHALASKRGDLGLTADEVAALWDVSHNHVAPRITELKATGRLVATNERRPTRSGRKARVLVAA